MTGFQQHLKAAVFFAASAVVATHEVSFYSYRKQFALIQNGVGRVSIARLYAAKNGMHRLTSIAPYTSSPYRRLANAAIVPTLHQARHQLRGTPNSRKNKTGFVSYLQPTLMFQQKQTQYQSTAVCLPVRQCSSHRCTIRSKTLFFRQLSRSGSAACNAVTA